MLAVMVFVFPSHHCLGWSPAHLGTDEHPPACAKKGMNSWFCFLAQFFLPPWTCVCLSPGVRSFSLSASHWGLQQTGHDGQVSEKETGRDVAVDCCHGNKYRGPSVHVQNQAQKQADMILHPSLRSAFPGSFPECCWQYFCNFSGDLPNTSQDTRYQENYVRYLGLMFPRKYQGSN